MKIPNEVKIGIAVVLAGTVFYLGTRYFRDLPILSRAHTYYTEFVNANGLVAGNVVSINGVNVGSVSDVQLVRAGARVAFSVSEDVVITQGSTAKVGGLSFISSIQLDIVLGPADAPQHAPGDFIPAAEQVDFLGEIAERAPDILSRADTLLKNTRQALNTAETLVSDPTSDLLQTMSSVKASADALHTILLAEQRSIVAVLSDIQALAGAIMTLAQDSLAVTVDGVNVILERMEQNLASLETTTTALSDLLTKINSGQGTLGRLVTEDSLYTELHQTVSALRRILEDFEEDPRQYLRHLKLVEIF